jgi:hypothetical protein
MEDIAGLRVVLPNGPTEVQALLGRIRNTWPDNKHKDYVAQPKRTGYRAIHAFVTEDSRTVEIQLRTPSQNRWADEVEAAANRLDYLLKDGEGPQDLLRYFERAAYKLATEEQGGELDEAFRRASRFFARRSASISSDTTPEREPSYFLLVFDSRHGTLVSQERISDPTVAMDTFAEAERRHAEVPDLQVLMFSADSIETVRSTHPHYFAGPHPNTDPFSFTPVATPH